MGIKLKSKELCGEIITQLKKDVSLLKKSSIEPTLASVLIGNDGGSIFYTGIQKKKCDEVGIKYNLHRLPEDISFQELKTLVEKLNNDENIHGILIQSPLPKGLDGRDVFNLIKPEKDIDCQTTTNIGKVYSGEFDFAPCTAISALELAKQTGVKFEGKDVVVIGRSNVVGKPLFQLLNNENATVTVCHLKSKDIDKKCREADIVFACAGSPKLVDASYVKEGSILIDIGTTNVDGKIVGDINLEEVIDIADYVSTVPGGVGPLTTIILLRNVVSNAKKSKE
ncbi:bifunctional 5,10-methylenetetrahydrofolate dehydrogenase/5,10-methenyltetrahydrofolate cyclohydrolase [Oceanirhabdus sp. W0125-5]|uniref:bifunctional 5,10-methylenetetrahydrofolate dehydrogenase/5,10-methenyltetrahydrofolate cyclohydrolase n=1 Tax=Oceanirhabdus sp. W0125-5 TaxID=2999116 RepID=UPI0022F2C02A|nr:tetrahydrofolate dehydrogenase/cyclohydrolase catalytic domain-containing protein [Oceanirhabdus sp. W0125-5]WBW95325.1 tetrahydrofolate dehydrogenase/cyclohydrolase catalytic domain-containing protein [Oceanirhabdus sp. W0125-5]